ncbi:MAG: hypothetical protein AAFQ94_11275 [Bacteroidota bacterium]
MEIHCYKGVMGMNILISKTNILLLLILSMLLISGSAFAQFQEGDYEYKKEVTWGINKNTNGGVIGGIMLKLGLARSEKVYEIYSLELSNVKHPQELSYNRASRFIWGKQNYLYSIRFQYGRERILFRKAPQQGVQISTGATIGPSIGLITPYFIQYTDPQNYVAFDPDVHAFGNILGAGRLFQGLGDSQMAIGANLKGFVNFEFGTFKNNVAGLEVGLLLEGYHKEIIIVPTQENNAIFTSAFFTLYWGSRK